MSFKIGGKLSEVGEWLGEVADFFHGSVENRGGVALGENKSISSGVSWVVDIVSQVLNVSMMKLFEVSEYLFEKNRHDVRSRSAGRRMSRSRRGGANY